jgi:uncharacterized protein with PQ loop repeat
LYGFSRITRTSIAVQAIQVDKILNGAVTIWQAACTVFFIGAVGTNNVYLRPVNTKMNYMPIIVPNHLCGHLVLLVKLEKIGSSLEEEPHIRNITT